MTASRDLAPATLAVAGLLFAACGGGVDGRPVAPPTVTAAPAPEPAPEPPAQVTGIEIAEIGQHFVRWSWDPVETATGYDADTFLVGTPPGERGSGRVFVEEPSVRMDGFDPDSELEFVVRAARETAGGRIFGPWSDHALAKTWGVPRECTNELEQAIAFGWARDQPTPVLIEEWDGTPFRFYVDDGIPDSERADAEWVFEVAERLARRIEDQIEYSIFEVAGWIPEEDRGFIITHRVDECVGVRPGGLVATVVPWERPGGGAIPRCAVFHWNYDDIDTEWASTVAHETFHLLGFAHHPPRSRWPEGAGVAMSSQLTGVGPTPTSLGVTFEDVDALRCIFPEQ